MEANEKSKGSSTESNSEVLGAHQGKQKGAWI